jgi:hypothetical protein
MSRLNEPLVEVAEQACSLSRGSWSAAAAAQLQSLLPVGLYS